MCPGAKFGYLVTASCWGAKQAGPDHQHALVLCFQYLHPEDCMFVRSSAESHPRREEMAAARGEAANSKSLSGPSHMESPHSHFQGKAAEAPSRDRGAPQTQNGAAAGQEG